MAHQLLEEWIASFPEAGRDTAWAATTKSTRRTYAQHFQRFLCFVLTRGKRFEACSLDDIFQFLRAYSQVAPKFNSVASAATAIRWYLRKSPTMKPLDEDARWKTFLKGMKRLCDPPAPKYLVWNPRRVLDHIASSAKPTELIDAGSEAAVLLMLATGSRLDDIIKLSARFDKMDFAVRLFFAKPRKTDCRKQWVSHIDVGYFPDNPRICPARAMLRFLRVSHPRRSSSADACFISSTGRPAAKKTVKRWVEELLARAGVLAAAGSIRSASSSAAYASGVDIDAILKSAGWRHEETWRRHYLRPVLSTTNLFSAYAPKR